MKFKIGSISKQFTTMAVLILEEKQQLQLTDKISKHLDNLPSLWRDISIHQFLSHTSGIIYSWALKGFARNMAIPRNLDDVIGLYSEQPLLFKPGEVSNQNDLFRVSHSGGVPGFSALIERYPNEKILVVILSNNARVSRKIFSEFPKLVLTKLKP